MKPTNSHSLSTLLPSHKPSEEFREWFMSAYNQTLGDDAEARKIGWKTITVIYNDMNLPSFALIICKYLLECEQCADRFVLSQRDLALLSMGLLSSTFCTAETTIPIASLGSTINSLSDIKEADSWLNSELVSLGLDISTCALQIASLTAKYYRDDRAIHI